MSSGVFDAGGLLRASSAGALEQYLRRHKGVERAEANPVSQTVTVAYDDKALASDDVRQLIEAFGCSCGGEIVPRHLCQDERPTAIGGAVTHAHVMAAPAKPAARLRPRRTTNTPATPWRPPRPRARPSPVRWLRPPMAWATAAG